MKVQASVLVPLIGFLGIVLGAAAQALIARANRRHERLLAFEMKRAEARLEAYVEVVRFVLLTERREGRHLGIFLSDEIEPTPGDGADTGAPGTGTEAPRVSSELAARVAALDVNHLSLTFSSWRLSRGQHVAAKTAQAFHRALVEEGIDSPLSDHDVADLERLIMLTNRHAGEFARKILQNIQHELAGLPPWWKTRRRLRDYLRDRKRDRARFAEGDFVEDASDRIAEAIREIAASYLVEPVTEGPGGASEAGAQLAAGATATTVERSTSHGAA